MHRNILLQFLEVGGLFSYIERNRPNVIAVGHGSIVHPVVVNDTTVDAHAADLATEEAVVTWLTETNKDKALIVMVRMGLSLMKCSVMIEKS